MKIRPEINLTEDFQKKISSDIFESSNRPMTKLLVDMETMFDYKLAALFGMIKTEKEYEYILNKLPLYSKYKGRQVTKCFPSLKFTEDDVMDFISKESNKKYLSTAGLITNVTNLVPAQLAMFDWVNNNSPLYDKSPIEVYFYNELFKVSDETSFQIDKSLRTLFPNINCYFVNKDINKENEDFLQKIDHFIVDNFKKFTEEKSVTYKMLLSDYKFIGSMISATIQFEEDDPYLEDEQDERIKATMEAMNVFCCFMLFNKQLLNKPYKEVKK